MGFHQVAVTPPNGARRRPAADTPRGPRPAARPPRFHPAFHPCRLRRPRRGGPRGFFAACRRRRLCVSTAPPPRFCAVPRHAPARPPWRLQRPPPRPPAARAGGDPSPRCGVGGWKRRAWKAAGARGRRGPRARRRRRGCRGSVQRARPPSHARMPPSRRSRCRRECGGVALGRRRPAAAVLLRTHCGGCIGSAWAHGRAHRPCVGRGYNRHAHVRRSGARRALAAPVYARSLAVPTSRRLVLPSAWRSLPPSIPPPSPPP